MMTRQEQCIPGIFDAIIVRECASPKTVEQFSLSVAAEGLGSATVP